MSVVEIIVEYAFFWEIARERARRVQLAQRLVSVGRPGYTRPFHESIQYWHYRWPVEREFIEDER